MTYIFTGITIGFVVALIVIHYARLIKRRPPIIEPDTDFSPHDDWEPQTETVMEEKTEMSVSVNTQMNCPNCNGKSYLKDGKCVKCDHQLI